MTTTPKELLAAARDLENHAYDMMRTHRHMDSEDEQIVLWSKQHMLADHIRSTVRADDDDPVDWGKIISSDIRLMMDGRMYMFAKGSENVLAIIQTDCITTRGEFRSICRALGITLPEVTA